MQYNDKNHMKIINLVSYLALLTVSGLALTGTLGRTAWLNVLLVPHNKFIPDSKILYLFLLMLFLLGLFTLFQLSVFKHKQPLIDKIRFTLGWTVPFALIAYGLGILFRLYQLRVLSMAAYLIGLLVLLIANGNIRADAEVMNEKLWVRNPHSVFTGMTLFMLMITIGAVYSSTFRFELSAIILLAVFCALAAWISTKNKNIGLLLTFAAALMTLFKGFRANDLFSVMVVTGAALLVVYSIVLVRQKPTQEAGRRLARRAMPKYNGGRPNNLKGVLDPKLYKEADDL